MCPGSPPTPTARRWRRVGTVDTTSCWVSRFTASVPLLTKQARRPRCRRPGRQRRCRAGRRRSAKRPTWPGCRSPPAVARVWPWRIPPAGRSRAGVGHARGGLGAAGGRSRVQHQVVRFGRVTPEHQQLDAAAGAPRRSRVPSKADMLRVGLSSMPRMKSPVRRPALAAGNRRESTPRAEDGTCRSDDHADIGRAGDVVRLHRAHQSGVR